MTHLVVDLLNDQGPKGRAADPGAGVLPTGGCSWSVSPGEPWCPAHLPAQMWQLMFTTLGNVSPVPAASPVPPVV